MKIVNLPCPRCGATLKINIESREAHCPFCNADFPIEQDLTKTAKDFEEAGYKFEKGRQRAQSENDNISNKPDKNLPRIPKKAVLGVAAIAIIAIIGIIVFLSLPPSNERIAYLSEVSVDLPLGGVELSDSEKDELLTPLPKALHFKNEEPQSVDVEFNNRTETGKLTIDDDKMTIELTKSGEKLIGTIKGSGRYVLEYSDTDHFDLTFIESGKKIENPDFVVERQVRVSGN